MSSPGHLPELDALRSQVADLSHQLAGRDRSAQHQREQSDLLRAIVEGTAAETGEEFFSALVTHLTSVLHVKYALIGEVQGDHIKKIRTLAVSAGGAIVDNFEYAHAHTPCASALTQSFACFDRNLQTMFPQFTRLADLGAESYCAVPLRTKGGAVMGLLVVMDTKPLQQGDDLQALLEVFAPRVAAEFERRRAEQERAQALADLHNVIETIPDIVFALDTQGNVVKWNRRLGDVTGYSSEELLNKPALAFVPPEEQARTAAAIQRVFMEGYAELEGHLLTKEHHLIPYHWTGALLKNSHGEPVGITGIGRDVSEKKRAEEERQRQQRHLVEAQTLAHLGSWHWDVDSGKAQWSDEQYRIFGHEPGSISVTYDTFLVALFPGDLPVSKALVARLVSGALTHGTIEKQYVKKDGSIMWAQTTVSSILDEQGDYEHSVAMIQDITTRKINEQLLAAQKRLLEMIATDAPLQEILTLMCQAVEELSPGVHCSILLLDRDGLHLRHGAAPSLPRCMPMRSMAWQSDRPSAPAGLRLSRDARSSCRTLPRILSGLITAILPFATASRPAGPRLSYPPTAQSWARSPCITANRNSRPTPIFDSSNGRPKSRVLRSSVSRPKRRCGRVRSGTPEPRQSERSVCGNWTLPQAHIMATLI